MEKYGIGTSLVALNCTNCFADPIDKNVSLYMQT